MRWLQLRWLQWRLNRVTRRIRKYLAKSEPVPFGSYRTALMLRDRAGYYTDPVTRRIDFGERP